MAGEAEERPDKIISDRTLCSHPFIDLCRESGWQAAALWHALLVQEKTCLVACATFVDVALVII